MFGNQNNKPLTEEQQTIAKATVKTCVKALLEAKAAGIDSNSLFQLMMSEFSLLNSGNVNAE